MCFLTHFYFNIIIIFIFYILIIQTLLLFNLYYISILSLVIISTFKYKLIYYIYKIKNNKFKIDNIYN